MKRMLPALRVAVVATEATSSRGLRNGRARAKQGCGRSGKRKHFKLLADEAGYRPQLQSGAKLGIKLGIMVRTISAIGAISASEQSEQPTRSKWSVRSVQTGTITVVNVMILYRNNFGVNP